MSIARLRRAFSSGRKALVTYVMGGDGGPEASVANVLACAHAGADVVELGFPFSDPIADGRVIQAAATRALEAGTTLEVVFDIAQQVRAKSDVALVLMGYLNPVLSFGIERFMARCKQAGVDGVIVPDLPPEEAAQFCAAATANDVGTVFMLAPTSTPARERAVIDASTGFIYFVSVTGVTGARTEVPDIAPHVSRVRQAAQVPVVVGFGISTPAQAKTLAAFSDGVVVGSALVERLAKGEGASGLVASLRAGLD